MGDDPYAVLGVPRGATSAEIKRAYRLLALKHHPDVSKDAPSPAAAAELFKAIRAAYLVLSNEDSRAQYDMRTQFLRKTNRSMSAIWAQDDYYYPDPNIYYRWADRKKRMRHKQQRYWYKEAIHQQEEILDENRGPFTDVLRFAIFFLFLLKTVGQFVALTVGTLFALLDDELDNGYKLGYLISWLVGGRGGVILMLFIRFTSWLSGKNSSGLLVLVVLALWVGVSLARFVPLPQGALLALLYMSMKLHDDSK